jgi:hypothetical protein
MPISAKPRVLVRLCLALSMPLAVQACVGAPPIVAIPAACANLLPDAWRVPVPGAPLPEGSTVADWISFADQQTGQLDKANDRTLSAIGIIERCEARDEAAVKRARRGRFMGLF